MMNLHTKIWQQHIAVYSKEIKEKKSVDTVSELAAIYFDTWMIDAYSYICCVLVNPILRYAEMPPQQQKYDDIEIERVRKKEEKKWKWKLI